MKWYEQRPFVMMGKKMYKTAEVRNEAISKGHFQRWGWVYPMAMVAKNNPKGDTCSKGKKKKKRKGADLGVPRKVRAGMDGGEVPFPQ